MRRTVDALRRSPTAAAVLLAVVVAALSFGTHRSNLDYGDDAALYLRQAKALLDGDIGRVVDDNAAMLAVDPGQPYAFSPTAYPWVTPLLYAPFVRIAGPQNWAGLRAGPTLLFALWVVLFVRLLLRRVPPAIAFGVTSAIGVALPYTAGTNSILSEVPFLLVGTGFLLALDHASDRGDLLRPTWAHSWLLGGLGCAVFNTRREGLAVLAGIAAVQLHGVWVVRRAGAPQRPAVGWWRPYAVFATLGVAAQALLPSALFPRYSGSGVGVALRKVTGPFRHALSSLLGFGLGTTVVGTVIVIAAAVGVVARVRRGHDIGLVAFVAGSTVIAASHPAFDPRYMMFTTPFVVYLAAVGVRSLVSAVRVPAWVALIPLAALVTHGAAQTIDRIADVRGANDRGDYLLGPGDPAEDAAIQAVRDHTSINDTVAFFKARALTYLTDRRAIQTADRRTLLTNADYYLQRDGEFGEPGGFSPFFGLVRFTAADAADIGLVEVWRNDRWVLWWIPDSAGDRSAEG